MNMNPLPKVGQVWGSNDPRDADRQMVVTHVGNLMVFLKNLKTGRHSSIAMRRMRSLLGRRGYRLVREEGN